MDLATLGVLAVLVGIVLMPVGIRLLVWEMRLAEKKRAVCQKDTAV